MADILWSFSILCLSSEKKLANFFVKIKAKRSKNTYWRAAKAFTIDTWPSFIASRIKRNARPATNLFAMTRIFVFPDDFFRSFLIAFKFPGQRRSRRAARTFAILDQKKPLRKVSLLKIDLMRTVETPKNTPERKRLKKETVVNLK